MAKYNIYAGVYDCEYRGTGEFNSEAEAMAAAYNAAVEDYEDYSGNSLTSYGDILKRVMEEYPEYNRETCERIADDEYEDCLANWIQYRAVLTSEDKEAPENIFFDF